MHIIAKDKNHILYNPENEFIDDTIEPSTVPKNQRSTKLLADSSASSQKSLDIEKKKRIEKLRAKKAALKENIKDTSSQNIDLSMLNEQINQKTNYIFELLKQYIAMNKIVKRNSVSPSQEKD